MAMAMEVDGDGGGAGRVLDLAPGSSIPIHYHSRFGSHDDLVLLEVDDKLLPEILGNRVTIRGQPEEDAVFCTPSTTYSMKFVGTSNTVFLIPPGNSTFPSSSLACHDSEKSIPETPEAVASVIKVARGHIELIQTAPRLEKLRSLLNERPYRLEEDLEDDTKCISGLYRWDDLVELIQASEAELRTGLKSLKAVEHDGYWRILDFKSMGEILSMILTNSVLHEWPLHGIDEERLLDVMENDDFPRRIVIHCLKTFGSKVENSGSVLWSLDEKEVCLHFAISALREGKMKLETFMEKWMQSIPEGMHADLTVLEGEVLYENFGAQTWIRRFSISSLPLTPAERFAALFRERTKWEWKDLEPFIRDLHVPGLSSEGLLIKYTRRTQPSADVEPIFSAR